MSTTISGVTARLGRDPDDIRKYAVTVQVYSVVKPGLKSSIVIDPGEVQSPEHLLKMVQAAGGACAEYLDEHYGDNIDPYFASKDALRAFSEEVKLQAALAKDVPAKLRRLQEKARALPEDARAMLSRLVWVEAKGEKLTPSEVSWIDGMIKNIHLFQM